MGGNEERMRVLPLASTMPDVSTARGPSETFYVNARIVDACQEPGAYFKAEGCIEIFLAAAFSTVKKRASKIVYQ